MKTFETPQSFCQFGLARCDVTPPVGIYHRTWGAATQDRATGVHRPLTATAMVFRAADKPASADTEQVLVAVDHCLLWEREMNSLLTRVWRKAVQPMNTVEVVFSHTHGAGLMGLERAALPGGDLIAPYLEKLAFSIADAIEEARRSLQPVIIAYGRGQCALAANRDFWDEDSRQFVCGFNPEGVVDDTVLVARVTGADGKTLAVVANYACHPTTLAWQNTLISPDFPGAMREVVEAAAGAPCVFLQGASGDVGPREGFVGDPAVADRNGRQLGYAVLAALESLPPPGTRFRYLGPVVSGATLGAWDHEPLPPAEADKKKAWCLRRRTVDLAYRPEIPTVAQTKADLARWQGEEQAALRAGDTARARDCHAMAERATRWLGRLEVLPAGKTFPLPVTLWRTGDAVWLAVEGEQYNLLQRALRDRFPGTPIMVMTLANGSRCTYLPTADAYGKGIYQESIAVLAPGCLEQLIEEIGREVDGLTE